MGQVVQAPNPVLSDGCGLLQQDHIQRVHGVKSTKHLCDVLEKGGATSQPPRLEGSAATILLPEDTFCVLMGSQCVLLLLRIMMCLLGVNWLHQLCFTWFYSSHLLLLTSELSHQKLSCVCVCWV